MTRIYLTQMPCVKCREDNADFIIHLSNTEREMEFCDEFKLQGICLSPECDCRFRINVTADEFAVFLENAQPLKEERVP